MNETHPPDARGARVTQGAIEPQAEPQPQRLRSLSDPESLRSFVTEVDVEAVLQESLLRVWHASPRFVPDGQPNALLRFAVRIAQGEVPPVLRNVTLRSLDLALLQAGAGVKGEFENRLKGLIGR